ncbi:FimD/PapC C-terminal domain-containing protein [Pseudoxanthomonas indica]|uniref:FimD/PapC C-terminal domain-containing protein n=1 Tax=Pseudoxanthomonas indica TaxID=428993 RepID=UPI003CCE4C76
MLVRTLLEDGRPVPFGARVMDPTGNVVGIVGQGGQVFIRSETRADAVLRVEWGEHGSCALDAAISANADPAENLEIVKATCRSYQ